MILCSRYFVKFSHQSAIEELVWVRSPILSQSSHIEVFGKMLRVVAVAFLAAAPTEAFVGPTSGVSKSTTHSSKPRGPPSLLAETTAAPTADSVVPIDGPGVYDPTGGVDPPMARNNNGNLWLPQRARPR